MGFHERALDNIIDIAAFRSGLLFLERYQLFDNIIVPMKLLFSQVALCSLNLRIIPKFILCYNTSSHMVAKIEERN